MLLYILMGLCRTAPGCLYCVVVTHVAEQLSFIKFVSLQRKGLYRIGEIVCFALTIINYSLANHCDRSTLVFRNHTEVGAAMKT